MSKITVITPVYNQQNYIRECVESVLSQDYDDFEYIVVDDGSDDKTPEILNGYQNDPRFSYIRRNNQGAPAALNTAIRNSAGEYIAWLSSDDVFLPDKLKEQADFFKRNHWADLTYTDFYIIDECGRIKQEIKSPYFEDKKKFIYQMMLANFINGSSVMFKKACVEKSGYFDEGMNFHADGNMWFRMLRHFDFGHLPKTLIKYRRHKSNLSRDYSGMKKYFYIYYKEIFDTYSVSDLCLPDSLSSANFELANALFERYRLYAMALSKLFVGIRLNRKSLAGYKLLLCFMARFPQKIFIDILYALISRRQKSPRKSNL